MSKELFGNMSEEFKAKAKECKSREEFNELVKAENIELTPEQVEALAGAGEPGCSCYFMNIDCQWVNH